MQKQSLEETEKFMLKELKKRAQYVNAAQLAPISDDYRFTNAGLYLLVGSIGSGKSFFISRHILHTEGYYKSIIFITSEAKTDETTETFLRKVKTPVYKVSVEDAIGVLSRMFKRKTKYYALYKAFMSDLKDIDDEAKRVFQKHALKKEKSRDIKNRQNPNMYMLAKFRKYNQADYPVRTLIVIDDAAGNSLIQKRNSQLIKIIKISRHLHATVILSAQTITDSMKDLKRITTDMVLFKNISKEDMNKVLSQIALPMPKDEILKLHSNLKGKHGKIILNIVNRSVVVEDP